jgi:hypothetical protein
MVSRPQLSEVLDHQEPGLQERVARFAEEVIPLMRR